ncbi:hypothetical protein [Tenacibaculum litoreum]|uniref:hypothetical protein n=1 Tax=Tenacibaculum litoreum TaxID=321269 RepID=UPI0038B56415
MKKQILNLGKNLNKTEQKTINGGNPICPEGYALELLCQSQPENPCCTFIML